MAARKTTLKAVDWLAFAERVPPGQKAMFISLKSKSDALSARMASLPEKPPTIDWSYYRNNIAKPSLVDEFEKKFNALKIPTPVDKYTEQINVQEQDANKSAQTYIQASKGRIVGYEKELEKLSNMIPFDQMTIEDLNEAFPETKLDKEKYPFWPHKPISDL